MLIDHEEYKRKLKRMKGLMWVFMCLLLIVPLAGIVALLLGFVEPGDGKGSMTRTEVCLVLSGFAAAILAFWKLLWMAMDWITKRQVALLFDGKK